MARGLRPCGDGPPKPHYKDLAATPHGHCPLCELKPGDPIQVQCPGWQPQAAELVAVSQIGITADVGGVMHFIPWAAAPLVTWEPVRYTDRGVDPE